MPEDSGYKPGMTPEQYFDHLCKTEAGEFIYKTVDGVEGLYMMRPRKEATDDELSHLHALEDPYGQVVGESDFPQNYYVQPAMGKYGFLEMPMIDSSRRGGTFENYKRYYRDEEAHPNRKYQTAINGQSVFVPYVVTEATVPVLKSRYGFTWRGITRPYDREFGITGGGSDCPRFANSRSFSCEARIHSKWMDEKSHGHLVANWPGLSRARR